MKLLCTFSLQSDTFRVLGREGINSLYFEKATHDKLGVLKWDVVPTTNELYEACIWELYHSNTQTLEVPEVPGDKEADKIIDDANFF